MTNEEFIGKMQMVYFGEKNALEECVAEYKKLKEDYNKVIHESTEFESKVYELQKQLKRRSSSIEEIEVEKVLDELNNVRLEQLNAEAKRLFNAIMKLADERDGCMQALNEIKEYIIYYDLDNDNNFMDSGVGLEFEHILQIIDKVGGNE